MKNKCDHLEMLNCKPEIRANLVSLFDKINRDKSQTSYIWLFAQLILHHYFTVNIISAFRTKQVKIAKSRIAVLLLLFLGNLSLAQISIDSFILDQRTKKPIDNVIIICSPPNNVAYSDSKGNFRIDATNKKIRLFIQRSGYNPKIINFANIKQNGNIYLKHNVDYVDEIINSVVTPDCGEFTIKGEVSSSDSFIQTLNSTISIGDFPYDVIVVKSEYNLNIPGDEIYRFSNSNKTLSVIAWKKKSFFKIKEIDLSKIDFQKNNVIKVDFRISSDDYIDTTRTYYLNIKNEELKLLIAEQNNNISALLAEVQYLNKELKSLIEKQQKSEKSEVEDKFRIEFLQDTINKITNELKNQDILRDSLDKIVTERELLIKSLKKFDEDESDITFIEKRLFSTKTRLLFTTNGLIINTLADDNLKRLSFIGLETDLSFLFNFKKSPVLSNLTSDFLFFAYFYLPQIQYSKFAPEWFIGFIPGKFNIGGAFTTYAGIGYGQGFANYEKSNSNVNQLLFNLCLSARVYDKNYFQVDLFSKFSNRIAIDKIPQPAYILQLEVIGLGISF